MKRLMIVVPCYNEQEVFENTLEALSNLLFDLIKKGKIAKNSGIMFVDDGSRDDTRRLITDAYRKYSHIYAVNLAGNVGHQNALVAGLQTAADLCDVTVTIDADLQDDVQAIEEMIDKFNSGCDVVYGVRNNRKSDSFFKRTTANAFYRVMKWLGAKTVDNHADFRLLSTRAVKTLLQYEERNLFLRGIVTQLGYKTDCVYYSRQKRMAGKTKYPFRKMLSFAVEGITSFSVKPLKMIMALGLFIILCSLLAIVYVLVSFFGGNADAGWPSLMISIWFLGGVQLFSIGLVGEYIGKIYLETKKRPRFNIEELLIHNEDE
ncbi:MAG: glycosyltransferase family 2 protein [Clostridia bacterium]|nr:glycosyltransferase family 2 protein [Clostridia bacterium]